MRFSSLPMRLLSILALIALANVFVFANGALSSSSSNVLMGKLITTSNRPILVNRGEAITGTVILSGAELITPAAGGATVELSNLGTLMVAPSTSLTVNFDAKSVTAYVSRGYASLATAEGVNGTVVLPTGATPPAVPANANNALYWGVAGVAVGGAGLIWAIIAHNRANDARDSANAANAAAASLASQLAALRTCLAGQTTSPLKLCTSF